MKKQSTSDREIYNAFIGNRDSISLVGKWNFQITRANGDIEDYYVENTLTKLGLNMLAGACVTNAESAFIYLAIGTQTAASSLDSVQGGMGEVSRKTASIAAGSNEVAVLVMTWAGNLDSLTSVDLRTAAAFNHPNSGSGIPLNFVNSVATILADSDFLKVRMEVQIGSHNL